MSSDLKLTVLLTVHNGMPFLPQTVQSILHQNDKTNEKLGKAQDLAFDFLIIDNASTDDTQEFLQKLSDPRINIVRNIDKVERSLVLNQALELIKTPYTAIIDADDLALPGRLAAQMEYLEANPNVALVGSNVRYINETGQVIGRTYFPSNAPTEHSELCRRLPVVNPFSHAACMFRTEAVNSVGGYPQEFKYAHDLALWLKLFLNGYKAASLQGFYAAIRMHSGQATKSDAYKNARLQDELELAKIMLTLPDFGSDSKQLTQLRMALSLWKLGQKDAAKQEFKNAMKERIFLFNPLIWLRAFEEVQKILRRYKITLG